MLSKIEQKISLSLITLFLVLPFSNLIFTKLDIWHAHGFFFQFGLLVIYSFHIFKKNKPLGSLIFWAGLLTSFYWLIILEKGKGYAVAVFLPFFNLLCAVIAYELIIKYFNKDSLRKLLIYLTIPVSLILIYSVLQKLQLDQFYNGLGFGAKDEVQGTIGNPMHLAHYLCICMPCFLLLKGEWGKVGILATLGVILLTGSASGLAIAILILIIYSFFKRIFSWRELIGIGLLISLFCIWQYKNLHEIIHTLTFSQGRFEYWEKLFEVFKKKSITGLGLGIMNQIAQQKEFLGWRHAHNEFYHFSVELGLIGLGIIIWGVIDYFKTFWKIRKESLSLILASMFMAFCLTSLVGFPAHLWLTATTGLLSYAGLYLLKESYDFNAQGNKG